MKKRFFILIFIGSFFLFIGNATIVSAQPFQQQSELFQQNQLSSEADGPPDPYCDPLCNCRKDGTICPIDNGLLALLAAGVIYGIKKVKDGQRVVE